MANIFDEIKKMFTTSNQTQNKQTSAVKAATSGLSNISSANINKQTSNSVANPFASIKSTPVKSALTNIPNNKQNNAYQNILNAAKTRANKNNVSAKANDLLDNQLNLLNKKDNSLGLGFYEQQEFNKGINKTSSLKQAEIDRIYKQDIPNAKERGASIEEITALEKRAKELERQEKQDYNLAVWKNETENKFKNAGLSEEDYFAKDENGNIKIDANGNPTFRDLNKEYENNKSTISKLNKYLAWGNDELSSEDIRKGREEVKRIEQENKKIETLIDNNAYLDTVYQLNNRELFDEKDIAKLEKSVGARSNSMVERMFDATVSAGVGAIGGLVDAYDAVKDSVLYTKGNSLIKNAEEAYKKGQISEEEYNELISKGQEYKDWSVLDDKNLSTMINELSQERAMLAINNTEGFKNFFLQSYQSNANFLINLAAAGPGGSLYLMATQSFGNKFRENISEGYSEDESLANAAFSGALTYVSENIGMDSLMDIVNSPSAQFTLSRVLVDLAKNGGSEALEEGFEYVMEPIIDYVTLGKEIEYSPNEFFMAMALGGFSGITLGAFGEATNMIKNRTQLNQAINQLGNLKSDKAALDLKGVDTTTYTNAINTLQAAIDNFNVNPNTKIARAIELETDNQTNETYTSFNELFKFNEDAMKPLIDKYVQMADEENLSRYKQNLQDASLLSQQLMDKAGINMDVQEFANLTEEKRANVRQAVEAINKLGINPADVIFTDTLGDVENINNAINSYSLALQEGRINENTYNALVENAKENYIVNGLFDGKKIIINADSKQAPLTSLIHELTHTTEGTGKYKVLKEVLFETLGQDTIANYSDIIRNSYQNFDGSLPSDSIIESEVIANLIQNKLGDGKFIDRMVNRDESLAYKLYDTIKNITDNSDIRKIENAFIDAFKARGSDVAKLGLQFSKTIDDNGVSIYDINDFNEAIKPYLEKNDGKLNKSVIDYLKANYKDTLIDIGNYYDIFFSTRSAEEYVHPSKRISNNIRDIKKAISLDLNGITATAQFLGTAENYHETKGKRQCDAYDYFEISFGIKNGDSVDYYKGLLNVGITNDRPRFYDITKINKTSGARSQGPSPLITYNLNSIPNFVKGGFLTGDDSNSNYRLDGTRKDLYASHNLSEENLNKALELGGLASPSIAITKDSIGHTNFGDISLLMDKNSIDPELNSANEVYTRDAWTSTFPKINYDINYERAKKLQTNLENLLNNKGVDENFSTIFNPDNINDSLKKDNLNRYEDLNAMKMAYLDEKGINYGDIPYKQVELSEGQNVVNNILNSNEISDVLKDKEVFVMGEESQETKNAINKIAEYYKKEAENKLANLPEDAPNFRKRMYERSIRQYDDIINGIDNSESHTQWNNIRYDIASLNQALKANANGGEVDVDTLSNNLNSLIDEGDYKEWVRNTMYSLSDKKGIYNGKEYLTPSGNRRSFNQLHDDFNLENIVKAMNEEGNTSGVFSGAGEMVARTSERLNSIQDIINNENNLESIDGSDKKALMDSHNETLLNLLSDIVRDNDFDYRAINNVGEVMIDSLKGNTPTEIMKMFNKASGGFYNIDLDTAKRIYDFKNDIQNIPTSYMEAKPRRALYFDEVDTAVLPKNASLETVRSLEDRNINIEYYDPKVEGDRQRVINEALKNRNLLFSKNLTPLQQTALDNGAILDTNDAHFYDYDNLIKFGDIDVKNYKSDIKTIRGNELSILNNAYENAVSINKDTTSTNKSIAITNNFDNTTSYFNRNSVHHAFAGDNSLLAIGAMENIYSIMENAVPINISFDDSRVNVDDKNYKVYAGYGNINGEPSIVRIIVKNGDIEDVTPLVYSVNTKRSFRDGVRHQNGGGSLSETSKISVANLLNEVNNIEEFRQDLPLNVSYEINDVSNPPSDRYTRKFSKNLNLANEFNLSNNNQYRSVLEGLKEDIKQNKDISLSKDTLINYIIDNAVDEDFEVNNYAKQSAREYFNAKDSKGLPIPTKLYADESLRAELKNAYGSLSDANRAFFPYISFTSSEGKFTSSVDEALYEFNEMYPGVISGDTTADNINQIHEILLQDNTQKTRMADVYGDDFYNYVEGKVNEFISQNAEPTTLQSAIKNEFADNDYQKYLDNRMAKDNRANLMRTIAEQPEIVGLDLSEQDIAKAFGSEIDRMSEQDRYDRLKRGRDIMIEKASDWIPNYEMLKEKYVDGNFNAIRESDFNEALFEILTNGEMSETTKKRIREDLIGTIFGNNNTEVNNIEANKMINQMVDESLEFFESDAAYRENKMYNESIASRANNIIKAYQGFGVDNYNGEFERVKLNKEQLKQIEEIRKIAKENANDYINTLITLGKDFGSRWQTMEQNLDVISNKNTDLRKASQNMFEVPKYQAQESYVKMLNYGADVLAKSVERGIIEGSEESKGLMWMLESKKADGTPYSEAQLKQDFDYEMKNGKKAYENILESSKEMREAYDTYYEIINNQREAIYGDVEEQNRQKTLELLAKLNEADSIVKTIETKMLNDGPTPELQSALNRATREYTRLNNEYNTKVEEDANGDSVRRQKLLYRENYAHHTRDRVGLVDSIKNIIDAKRQTPTKLSGISNTSKPRTGFASFFMRQNGGKYSEDAIKGFNEYIGQASKVIAYDPLIDYYRNINQQIRAQATGTEMTKFVDWLDAYTNNLAGKTQELDRSVKQMTGDRIMKSVEELNKMARKNMILFNLRTSLVQFANIPNATGVLVNKGGAKGINDLTVGSYNFFKNMFNENAIDRSSPFLNTRFFDTDTGRQGLAATADNTAKFLLEKGDEIATKMIWYGAYEQAQRTNQTNPIAYADDLTRRSVAGRSVGEVPLALQSKVMNLLMPFQVETNNAFQTMRNMIGTDGAKAAPAILSIAVAGWLMNGLYDKTIGDTPVFDPIRATIEGIEASIDDATVTEMPNGDEIKEYNWGHVPERIVGEILSNMPGGSYLPGLFGLSESDAEKIFGSTDPSRYGTGNAGLAGLGKLYENARDGDWTGFASNLMANYLMPGGGKQAQRSIEALQTYGILPQQVNGEWQMTPTYYSKSGRVGYVNDSPTKDVNSFINFAKSVAFGKWAGDDAREYIDSGFKSLTDAQTNVFNLLNNSLDAKASYDLTKDISKVESIKDEDGKTISNSKALQIRGLLEEQGVYDDFLKAYQNGDVSSSYLTKTVVNMSSKEFEEAYREVMGKNITTTSNDKKNEKTLNAFSSNAKTIDLSKTEVSQSGNIYPKGKKPSQQDYIDGLENFFEKGDVSYSPKGDGTYTVRKWNGKAWEDTGKTVTLDETKTTNTKTSSSAKSSAKSSKSSKKTLSYEQEKAKIDKLILQAGTSTGGSLYSSINKLLKSSSTPADVKKKIESIKKKYEKSLKEILEES